MSLLRAMVTWKTDVLLPTSVSTISHFFVVHYNRHLFLDPYRVTGIIVETTLLSD